ncbi:MAG: 16S rRNA (uracil(1498)-N(3))-methyltransferase [Lachnospiraceae bacterium]|nr:16S rRNA (uracil(1498)-N(3))-methyltransferase [Lachnospiraceae bacterium]
MQHFFVEPIPAEPKEIRVFGGDFNHIKNVLRMKKGEKAVLSDECGGVYLCALAGFTENEAVFEVMEPARENELRTPVTLYQGLPKADKLEQIIQKAVELGAYRIVPVEMKRSVVKSDPKKAEAKTRRRQTIAEAAAKQSGRAVIPQVSEPVSFAEALADAAGTQIMLPYESAEGIASLYGFLDSIETGKGISVFIGPEGGFDPAEIQEAQRAGAVIVSLGKRILRTETAALTALSVLMTKLELLEA